jgi:proteic killer suppression protein
MCAACGFANAATSVVANSEQKPRITKIRNRPEYSQMKMRAALPPMPPPRKAHAAGGANLMTTGLVRLDHTTLAREVNEAGDAGAELPAIFNRVYSLLANPGPWVRGSVPMRLTIFFFAWFCYQYPITYICMIITFRRQLAEDLFFDRRTGVTRRFPAELRQVAQRKLQYLNAAARLNDLKAPPGNRLEALKGALKGYHSIRINDQWRIVFQWRDGAYEVQIVDYH